MIRTILPALAVLVALAPPVRADKPRVKVEFRRAETEPAPGLVEMTTPDTKWKIYVHKTAELTHDDISAARILPGAGDGPSIEVTFAAASRARVARLTEEHNGKPLAILIDGQLVSAPVIRAKFSERAVIAGRFSDAEAQRIAVGLGGK